MTTPRPRAGKAGSRGQPPPSPPSGSREAGGVTRAVYRLRYSTADSRLLLVLLDLSVFFSFFFRLLCLVQDLSDMFFFMLQIFPLLNPE